MSIISEFLQGRWVGVVLSVYEAFHYSKRDRMLRTRRVGIFILLIERDKGSYKAWRKLFITRGEFKRIVDLVVEGFSDSR